MSENEKPINEEKQAHTDQFGYLDKVKLGDKELKVVNTVKIVEIVVHKLETGQEVSQVIAHEFMMVDHKPYMVKLLTEAINTVMRAQKRKNYIKLCTEATFNKIRNAVGLKRFLNNKKPKGPN